MKRLYFGRYHHVSIVSNAQHAMGIATPTIHIAGRSNDKIGSRTGKNGRDNNVATLFKQRDSFGGASGQLFFMLLPMPQSAVGAFASGPYSSIGAQEQGMVIAGRHLRHAHMDQSRHDGGCRCGFKRVGRGIDAQPQLPFQAVANTGALARRRHKQGEIKPTRTGFD